MKPMLQRLLRAAVGVGMGAVLAVLAIVMPGWVSGELGERLALLTASLTQPQQGLQLLSREWQPPQTSDAPQPTAAAEPTLPALPEREETREQAPDTGTAAAVIPPKGEGGGTVIEEQIGGGTALSDTVYMKNSSGFDRDFAALLQQKTDIRFADTDEPQVLIVHSHTTESYMTYYAGYYNEGDCARSTDTEHNLCVVGEVLANRLRAAGIGVIHDREVHDYPQYTGAYDRSGAVVQETVARYPSLRLVIDLHRDALQRDDTTKVKPTVTVGDEKAAQMMLVVGAASYEDAPNPYWETNVVLGLQLQSYLSGKYEGLMRPISFTESRYNQQMFPGFLLIEMGSDTNTFREAMYSAGLLGDALLHILREGA